MKILIINNLGCDIHYWLRKGTGKEFILFLHGACCDHKLFEMQFQAIPDNYNIIAWDARGHGESVLSNNQNFDYKHMIDDVCAICKKNNISSAIFIGQSMGGNLAQDIAYYHPEIVKAMVLIDCTRNTAKLTSFEKLGLNISPYMFKLFPTKSLFNLSAKMCGKTKYTREYAKRMFLYIGKKRYIQIMDSLQQALHKDDNYRFHCPVLLICGEDDKTGNIVKTMKSWTSIDSSCKLVWIRNAGHCANQDNPLEVNNEISLFLNTILLQTQ